MIVQFTNKMTKENATCKKISEHVVEVKGLDQNLSGFKILTKNDILMGDYSAYTTLYRTVDGGFQYSNNGSVYEEPAPEPIPEPTLDDVKAVKVSEMNTIQQQTIANGCEVQLADGSKETFTLTQNDQLSLNSLSVKVLEGMTFVPWHPANEDAPCKFYTEADMKTITDTCLNFVSWHVTWFRDLRRYIRSLTTKEEVEAITYDSYIPTEYQSEVLIAMMSQKSSQGV